MWHPDAGDKELKDESIKDEPFEELYVPESTLNSTDDKTSSCETCFLCQDGSLLQQRLVDHVQACHTEDGTFQDQNYNLTCCFCEEGLQIQTELINHLLSHFTVKSEVDSIRLSSFQPVIPASSRRHTNEEQFAEEFLEADSDDNTHETPKQRNKHRRLQRNLQDNDPDSSRNARHQRVSNSDTAKIKCNFCPKLFMYKQGVQKHWDLEHNPANAFPCTRPACSSRCKTLKNLHAHLRVHDPSREGVASLQCHKCFKTLPSQKQLSLHYYTHREKFFCCDICGSKFNNREQIKNHVLRHVGLFQKRFSPQRIICDECSMLVLTHKMKRHKMIHHLSEKPFKCHFPDCTAAFSDNRILSDHKNIHLKIKPYKCEYCSESFRSGANLRLHRVRHTDPDRYRCDHCQTSFVTKQALQKHNRKHTDDPDIRPYACEFPGCNSTFKQKDHVRSHFRRTHEKTDEVFRCTMENCTKVYDRKDALGKHLRKAHNVCKRKPRVFPVQEINFV